MDRTSSTRAGGVERYNTWIIDCSFFMCLVRITVRLILLLYCNAFIGVELPQLGAVASLLLLRYAGLSCHVKVDSKVDSKVTKPIWLCHLCHTLSVTYFKQKSMICCDPKTPLKNQLRVGEACLSKTSGKTNPNRIPLNTGVHRARDRRI